MKNDAKLKLFQSIILASIEAYFEKNDFEIYDNEKS